MPRAARSDDTMTDRTARVPRSPGRSASSQPRVNSSERPLTSNFRPDFWLGDLSFVQSGAPGSY